MKREPGRITTISSCYVRSPCVILLGYVHRTNIFIPKVVYQWFLATLIIYRAILFEWHRGA